MSLATTDTLTTQIASSIQQVIDVQANTLRKDALDAFRTSGLPGRKNEEYKYTPITQHLEKGFSFLPSPASGPLNDIKKFFIAGLDAYILVFIDGVYSEEHSIVPSQNKLKIQRLEQALHAQDKTAVQHFGKYINYSADAFAAWNTAGWQHGIFIHAEDNIAVEKPVVIYHIANATAGEIVAVNRNLIVVGRNSELTVIEKFDSEGKGNHFSNFVNEVVVDENAGINLYSIQNDAGQRYQVGLTEIYQKNSSRVNTYTFSLQGKLIRNNLHLQLDGEGIESHMYGLYLLGGDTLVDNHTVADHKKANSFSNELYKGIMDDNSRGVFNGKIFVRPNAQKTNAFQANRNISLTDKATINTKPQLEIWADDVKCSHGCTSGQLDEEAVFYLQARGISKETARAMMLYAFAGEVLESVKHPVIKEYLDSEISTRLHKNF